jgi:hypothetical protein
MAVYRAPGGRDGFGRSAEDVRHFASIEVPRLRTAGTRSSRIAIRGQAAIRVFPEHHIKSEDLELLDECHCHTTSMARGLGHRAGGLGRVKRKCTPWIDQSVDSNLVRVIAIKEWR